MPDENLLKYIKDGLAQGRTEDIIRSMLSSAGWAEKDVNEAFIFIHNGGQPVTPAPVQQPVAVQPAVRPLHHAKRKPHWLVCVRPEQHVHPLRRVDYLLSQS